MSEERVQKALSRIGVGSRREIERLVEQGKVKVNGKVISAGAHVKPGDKVIVGTRSIVIREPQFRTSVLVYNKPEGEICTRNDEKNRKTVFEALPKLFNSRWVNIGRLDINTCGLLLFTNNGELANKLMHPSSEIEREYAVRVNGEVTSETLAKLKKGLMLEDGKANFEKITDAGGQGRNHWYHVVLKEGRNREVRRLWEAVDMSVSRLIRVRYGYITLPRDLRRGKTAELNSDEVKQLLESVNLEDVRDHSAPRKRAIEKPQNKHRKDGGNRNTKRSTIKGRKRNVR